MSIKIMEDYVVKAKISYEVHSNLFSLLRAKVPIKSF